MSQPQEPTPLGGAGKTEGVDRTEETVGRSQPPTPADGALPPAESEPAPSAASATDAPTVTASPSEAPTAEQVPTTEQVPPAEQAPPAGQAPPVPPGGPAGHYVFVPAGTKLRTNRFGPAMGRFARNRATQLVAAVVLGAIVGGGTVAIVDTAHNHGGPGAPFTRFERPGTPFGGNGFGHRAPGGGGFQGNQGSGQGGQGSGG